MFPIHHEGNIAQRLERLGEDDAMVGGRGLAQLGPLLRIVVPWEGTTIDYGTSNMCAMTPDELGGRVQDDIDAMFGGTQ